MLKNILISFDIYYMEVFMKNTFKKLASTAVKLMVLSSATYAEIPEDRLFPVHFKHKAIKEQLDQYENITPDRNKHQEDLFPVFRYGVSVAYKYMSQNLEKDRKIRIKQYNELFYLYDNIKMMDVTKTLSINDFLLANLTLTTIR